jgi:phosphatidylglycerophosphatase A
LKGIKITINKLSAIMKRLLTSCFGLGRLPVAPGTWGSLPPAIIFGLLYHFGISTASTAVIMAVTALASSVICIKFAPAVIAATNKTDPREVVADELSGQSITFLFIMALPVNSIWITILLGFLLFRFFDIIKPWPVRRLEKLPKGWGILMDDLLAGVFAGIASLICLAIWDHCGLFGER